MSFFTPLIFVSSVISTSFPKSFRIDINMSATLDIQALPIELFNKILDYVSDDRANGQESIKNCRLVSRHFNNVASTLLIPWISVCLTVESFARLEHVYSHPIFSRNVSHVTIILNFYEAELANCRPLFMKEARSRLLRHTETMERMPRYKSKFYWTRELHDWLSHMAWDDCPKLNQLIEEDNAESPPARIQKLFLKLYEIYKRRFDDQENLRRDNAHIDRLVTALSSLPGLSSLRFEDYNSNRAIVTSNTQRGSDRLLAADFEDSGYDEKVLRHFDRAVRPSPWCGWFETHQTVSPPVEMLGELCSRLGSNSVKIKHFGLSLYPPPNLLVLETSPTQQENIKRLVSLASNMRLHIDPYDNGHNYSKQQLLAVCSLTVPFTSAPNLETLEVNFGVSSGLISPVSLVDVLPPNFVWPRLQHLTLRNVNVKPVERRELVARHSSCKLDLY
ncbi:hypothetical protein FSPOR_4146 [Fusarium sporotrichioides]|uniref:F-box domain-containing protein n=1 Tax=Fusarium sporotrichioides TaxID=5514 RepID=A0A395SCV8_FUSSP|nr:hypothetical protein FSPOR_4146 [Fusarium sporotrichioides]